MITGFHYYRTGRTICCEHATGSGIGDWGYHPRQAVRFGNEKVLKEYKVLTDEMFSKIYAENPYYDNGTFILL